MVSAIVNEMVMMAYRLISMLPDVSKSVIRAINMDATRDEYVPVISWFWRSYSANATEMNQPVSKPGGAFNILKNLI